MNVMNHATAVGVFTNPVVARFAVNELRRLGFAEDQIGIVTRDAEPAEDIAEGSKWEEGAATGLAAGAGVGALWALGIAAGILPAIGPVVAGGLLVSVVASSAGGAAVAGLVGALIGLGIPEEHARYYEGEFKSGRTIVTVRAPGRYEEAEEVLRSHGGYDVSSVPTGTEADRISEGM